jgi:hypothetical protein
LFVWLVNKKEVKDKKTTFICGSFKDALRLRIIGDRLVVSLVNDELDRLRKKAVVA